MTIFVSAKTFDKGTQLSVAQNTKQHVGRVRSGRSGFVPRHPRFHSVYNRSIGMFAVLLASPLLLVISLALLVTQGSKIFYAGPRLGKDRKTFHIFKFRTLDTARARVLTSDKVLPAGSNLETPLGKYLRASRLDELPQLFNIARGDMNIVGPRPVRAEIAMIEETKNDNYPVRFKIKPGLVGQTQAFMGHGTSKAIRAKYNYALCSSYVNYPRELALFVGVGLAVLGRAFALVGKRVLPIHPMRAASHKAKAWNLRVVTSSGVHEVQAVTDQGLTLANRALTGPAELHITLPNGGLRRAKVDIQPLEFSVNPIPSHSFEPTNDMSAHLLSRFVRRDVVVAPRRPLFWARHSQRPATPNSGTLAMTN